MEMIRTKLDALKKLAGNLGVDPAETARCVTNNDALNLIAQHLGGETGARTNAEAIGHIAEVASAGGGEQNVEWVDVITTPGFYSQPAIGNTVGKYVKKLRLPEGVAEIGYNGLAGYEYLEEIALPESLTTIADTAFGGCKSLALIVIPKNVTSIASNSFSGCTALTEINIHKPEGSIEGAPWGATNATVNWLG